MLTARSFMRIPSKATVQKIFAEISKVPKAEVRKFKTEAYLPFFKE